jgi:hypothetical protein
MNPYFVALTGAVTRILLWAITGAFLALGVPPEIQGQINQFVDGNPFNAAMAAGILAAVWYGKSKLTKGET